MLLKSCLTNLFDYDASKQFHLAYEGECGRIASDQFQARNYTALNQRIGSRLASFLPKHYQAIANKYARISLGTRPTDAEMCLPYIAVGGEYPIVIHDLGCLGSRPAEIAMVFNAETKGTTLEAPLYTSVESEELPKIKELCLVDSSLDVIKKVLASNEDSDLEIVCAQHTELDGLQVTSIYEDTGISQQQFNPDGSPKEGYQNGEDATCSCNFQKRIITLLGRTINNMPNPYEFLEEVVYPGMNPLDVLVVEGRWAGNPKLKEDYSLQEYQAFTELMKKHVEINLGIPRVHTNNGGSIKIENIDGIICAYVTLKEDYVGKNSNIDGQESFFPKGSTILLAHNTPFSLPPDLHPITGIDFEQDSLFRVQDHFHHGQDSVFFLTKPRI
jgi:hypothetical protein